MRAKAVAMRRIAGTSERTVSSRTICSVVATSLRPPCSTERRSDGSASAGPATEEDRSTARPGRRRHESASATGSSPRLRGVGLEIGQRRVAIAERGKPGQQLVFEDGRRERCRDAARDRRPARGPAGRPGTGRTTPRRASGVPSAPAGPARETRPADGRSTARRTRDRRRGSENPGRRAEPGPNEAAGAGVRQRRLPPGRRRRRGNSGGVEVGHRVNPLRRDPHEQGPPPHLDHRERETRPHRTLGEQPDRLRDRRRRRGRGPTSGPPSGARGSNPPPGRGRGPASR